MSDIDTYDTQIAILNQVAEEMHKKLPTGLLTTYGAIALVVFYTKL